VMECWSVGVLECWSVGVMECWSVGVMEYCAKSELHLATARLGMLKGHQIRYIAVIGKLQTPVNHPFLVPLFLLRPFFPGTMADRQGAPL
jgi:hypothetical protein